MTALAAIFTSCLAFALRRKHGNLHPAFLLAGIWAVAFFVLSVVGSPMGLERPSPRAFALIMLGVGGFCAPALLARESDPREMRPLPRKALLGAGTIVVFILVVVGYLTFSNEIEQAAGRAFGELSYTEIRSFQISEDRSGVGVRGLLPSLAPLSLCLFVLAGRAISRIWYLGIAPVAYCVIQSPSRTSGLTALVAIVLFFAWSHPRPSRRHLTRHQIAWFFAAMGLIGAYFILVGSARDSRSVETSVLPAGWIPSPLVSPALYLVGGIPALSVVQTNWLGRVDFGRSVYAFLRLAQGVGLPVKAPEVIGEYVPIPFNFNVYTAFGDLWLDFGMLGTILVFTILGVAAHGAYVRARRGSLSFAWLSTLAGTWVLSTPLSFRVFYLDSLFLACAGVLIFVAIQGCNTLARDRRAVSVVASSFRPRESPPGSRSAFSGCIK